MPSKQSNAMFAISVRQPWAGLIILGFKPVENRSWAIPTKHRGTRVYIHAGKAVDMKALEYRGQFPREAAMALAVKAGVTVADFLNRLDAAPDAFRLGGIIGQVDLLGCGLNQSLSPWAIKSPRMWHWRLAAPKALPFMPCLGKQGFFKIGGLLSIQPESGPKQAELC